MEHLDVDNRDYLNEPAKVAAAMRKSADRPEPPLAPRPADIASTGLNETFLSELTIKHLYRVGVMDLSQLIDRMALAGPVLEPVISLLRNEACIDVLPELRSGSVRYVLTDRGRQNANDALDKSGYVGPAPVPLETYDRVVRAQSVRSVKVKHTDALRAFGDVVAPQLLIDRLGTAINSGRPLFLYGPPGTGKTYLGKRLIRMIEGDDILVPHAIQVGDTVIQLFDPSVHHPVRSSQSPSLILSEGQDPRFVRCRRPGVMTGGELTLDMLEVEYDPATKQYHAPQSLMANNGLYMIDDLGRQRVTPDAILNRWILPMEEGRDFLSFGAGQRFEVPFNVILIFSTNLNPLDLADEAFLRRLGHKVPFHYVGAAQYEQIWRRTCAELSLKFEPELLSQVLQQYEAERRPLLPCHPRDLLNSVVDRIDYEGKSRQQHIDMEQLQHAWNSYFVSLVDGQRH